jgi:transposase
MIRTSKHILKYQTKLKADVLDRVFACLHCGHVDDADHNASVNILHMGVFSTHSLRKVG